jgi:hypothetical protein
MVIEPGKSKKIVMPLLKIGENPSSKTMSGFSIYKQFEKIKEEVNELEIEIDITRGKYGRALAFEALDVALTSLNLVYNSVSLKELDLLLEEWREKIYSRHGYF